MSFFVALISIGQSVLPPIPQLITECAGPAGCVRYSLLEAGAAVVAGVAPVAGEGNFTRCV